MILTLREEILVVCTYETLCHGTHLYGCVANIRALYGIEPPSLIEFAGMLGKMVETDDLLEPWRILKTTSKRQRRYIFTRLGPYNPLTFYFKLTPKGSRLQSDLLDEIVLEEGPWQPRA